MNKEKIDTAVKVIFYLAIIVCVAGWLLAATDVQKELGDNMFIGGWCVLVFTAVLSGLFAKSDSPMALPSKIAVAGFGLSAFGVVFGFFAGTSIKWMWNLGLLMMVVGIVWGTFKVNETTK